MSKHIQKVLSKRFQSGSCDQIIGLQEQTEKLEQNFLNLITDSRGEMVSYDVTCGHGSNLMISLTNDWEGRFYVSLIFTFFLMQNICPTRVEICTSCSIVLILL